MTQGMKTGRYMRFIVTLLMLLVCGAGEVWSNDIVVIIDNGITHGTVTSSIDQTSRVVTLTVTPDAGYKTRTDLIMVEKMVNPGKQSAPRRAPGLGTFPVTGPNGWQSTGAQYTFTVTEDYDGAYVTADKTYISMINSGNSTIDDDGNVVAGLMGHQSNDGVSSTYNVITGNMAVRVIQSQLNSAIKMYLQDVKDSLGRKVLYRGLYPGE